MRRALLLAATFALVGTGTAVAQSDGLKVTGGGQVLAADQTAGPGDTIAFNAQQNSATEDNGSFPAKGQLQVINRTNDKERFHGVVTCIRTFEGDNGEMFTRFGGYQRLPGNTQGVPFTVDTMDNGEGASGGNDMIAFRKRGAQDDPCDDSDSSTELRSTTLARGNVQQH
ncbi:MAG TPA: hypothetical protein VF533_10875 [Solirubrobacteraceae bacterium]|jgi:hypothetical protein